MQKAISKYWPVFVLPTLIAFIIGFIWPFIWGTYLSFQRFTTVSKTTFVGIQNYLSVFQDSTFLHAFGFTAVFTVVSTVLINVCAFAIALVLTRGIKGTNLFRTVYFMPNLIGGILLGYIWQILLNGVLANLQKPLLALDAKAGFIGLVILMCWQQIGYMMIIYVAGLQSVPGDLIEAAKIDGAGEWQVFSRVCMPQCRAALYSIAILVFIDYWNMVEQPIVLLPDAEKQPLSVYLSTINTGEVGLAFAIATIYMVPTLLLFLHGEEYLVEGIATQGSVKG